MANIQGQLQLNSYILFIIYNMDQYIRLLKKSLACFMEKLLVGLIPNKEVEKNLDKSLMLVTSLSSHIGYDKASRIAKMLTVEN